MLNYPQVAKQHQFVPKHELWQHNKALELPDTNRVYAFYDELSKNELRAIELLCGNDIKKFDGKLLYGFSSILGIPLVLKAFISRAKQKIIWA